MVVIEEAVGCLLTAAGADMSESKWVGWGKVII